MGEDAFKVEVRVYHAGTSHKVTVTRDYMPGGDQVYRTVREQIRYAADAAARAFPDPASPYSDDLFKLGTTPAAQGIVDTSAKTV
jgi:hypothetical protein